MNGGLHHCTRCGEQNRAQEKEMQKGKWLSWESLQIAEKRRDTKGKGEKEGYTY